MSLSRILNDDPVPVLPARSSMGPRLAPVDVNLTEMSPLSVSSQLAAPRSRPPHSSRSDHREPSPTVRGYNQSVGPGGWNRYLGDRPQDDIYPHGPGGNQSYSERDAQRYMSPDDSQEASHQDGEDGLSRKRRRGGDDDPDYQPPGQRRVSLPQYFPHTPDHTNMYQHSHRKHSSRSKQIRTQSPGSENLESERVDARQRSSEEDLRLASSDLEDCEEVWIGELSEYMLETQKRQNQVESWFEKSIRVIRSSHLSMPRTEYFIPFRNATSRQPGICLINMLRGLQAFLCLRQPLHRYSPLKDWMTIVAGLLEIITIVTAMGWTWVDWPLAKLQGASV